MTEEKQTVRCPNCGTESIFDSSNQDKLYCQECGKDLTKYVITGNNTPKTEKTPEKIILCPNCGNNVRDNVVFCPMCGYDFLKKETSTCSHCETNNKDDNLTKKVKTNSTKKSSSTLETLSFFVGGTVFAVIFGFLALFWFGSKIYELSSQGSDNSIQQIFNAIQIVGMAVSAGIGIILAFIIKLFIGLITKLNIISEQISDLQKQNNK